MSWGSFGWRPYVPVAKRRANAAREVAKLTKKTGQAALPVVLPSKKIATTFWGKAWCDNLEAYSDFENRLPRGRTYVRNGSVVDLQIGKGTVTALVSGSSLYKIQIKIKPLAPPLWQSIQAECAGKIESLIELLQGKLSAGVMQIVTRKEQGLFPTPKEIDLGCSCPDWADLCKHVAASLYGVGARLDQNPGLLFLLRGVDPADLVSKVSAAEAVRQTTGKPGAKPVMSDAEVADVFGIELASSPEPTLSAAEPPAVTSDSPTKPASPPARKHKSQQKPKIQRPLKSTARSRILAAQRSRWEALKKRQTKVERTQAAPKGKKLKSHKPAQKPNQTPTRRTP